MFISVNMCIIAYLNTLTLSHKGLYSFFWGGSSGKPKGICAINSQVAGNFQVAITSSSIRGL